MTEPLHELLRHRPPMLLLDRCIRADSGSAEAEVTITEASTFYAGPEGVPAWIGIEYMAQTIGLLAGVDARSNGDEAPTGYLLGTRKLESSLAWFPEGACLRITAAELYVDDNGLGAYDCAIFYEGRRVCACRLTVYRRPRESAQRS